MEKVVKISSYVLGVLAVIFLVNLITLNKFGYLKNQQGLFSADVVSIKTIEKQLNCLALNIYREAGAEPFEGKVAVAQVTMNRVEHPEFPKDVCGVVYEKNVVMQKVVCQFSWACDSAVRARPVNKEAYDESYEVAKKVLLEGFRLDVLNDALYYHATYVNPRWNLQKVGKIGQHIFYREKGTKS